MCALGSISADLCGPARPRDVRDAHAAAASHVSILGMLRRKSPAAARGREGVRSRESKASSCDFAALHQIGCAQQCRMRPSLRGGGRGKSWQGPRQASASGSASRARGAYEASESRSIAPSSLAGRAMGEARAARARAELCLGVWASSSRLRRCDATGQTIFGARLSGLIVNGVSRPFTDEV